MLMGAEVPKRPRAESVYARGRFPAGISIMPGLPRSALEPPTRPSGTPGGRAPAKNPPPPPSSAGGSSPTSVWRRREGEGTAREGWATSAAESRPSARLRPPPSPSASSPPALGPVTAASAPTSLKGRRPKAPTERGAPLSTPLPPTTTMRAG